MSENSTVDSNMPEANNSPIINEVPSTEETQNTSETKDSVNDLKEVDNNTKQISQEAPNTSNEVLDTLAKEVTQLNIESTTKNVAAPSSTTKDAVNVTKFESKMAPFVKHLSSGISFQDPSLKIPPPILDALIKDLRFEMPSEIQAMTIPRIMTGRNIIAQAQTGSGKTVAFAIGMLACIDSSQNYVQALCLTPTRELAIQIIDDAIIPLSKYLPHITYELLVPDEPGKPSKLKGPVCTSHIVVGTPGTIKTLIARKYLKNLNQSVRVFVCDEADTMVNERGLGQDTVQIKRQLHPHVQTLFFSATYSGPILEFAQVVVPQASIIKLKTNADLLLTNIFQVRMNVNKRPDTGENKKIQILKEIYGFFDIEQSIVFVKTKIEATDVSRMFINEKYSVSSLHSDLGPEKRDEEFRKFREGKTKVLVTTNVLARGVNVPSVDVVINYDLPMKKGLRGLEVDSETYVHRMGRCGRFGRQGTAINLLSTQDDEYNLLEIERHYHLNIQSTNINYRITKEWDPNDIEGLADLVRQKSLIAQDPTHLETKVEVSDN